MRQRIFMQRREETSVCLELWLKVECGLTTLGLNSGPFSRTIPLEPSCANDPVVLAL